MSNNHDTQTRITDWNAKTSSKYNAKLFNHYPQTRNSITYTVDYLIADQLLTKHRLFRRKLATVNSIFVH